MSKELTPAQRPGAAVQLAGGLFGRATRLAGWAARTSYDLAKKVPGADAAERGLRQLERSALAELRRRIDEVTDPHFSALNRPVEISRSNNGSDDSHVPAGASEGVLVVASDASAQPLRAAMADLLNRSIGYSVERARDNLHASILRQLTPDEARIMSALSDGSPFPIIDVTERVGVNGVGRTVLRNFSSVGTAAGVTLPSRVPVYIARLVGLGLADIDEETPSLATQYEILLTDKAVRVAQEEVKRPKVVRRTVRISRYGVDFWQACDPATTG